MRINKTQFINYLKCIRLSWLTNKKNLVKNQNNVGDYIDDDLDQETLLDGMQVGSLARDFFTENYKSINIDFFENEALKISETKKAIKNKVSAIFEGFFASEKLVVKPDILIYDHIDKAYSLIEVKASTSIKKDHILDVMFQYLALTKLGIKINNIRIMILNKHYCRTEELDLSRLFIITSDSSIKASKSPPKSFYELIQEWTLVNDFDALVDRIILNNEKNLMPKIEMGGHCSGCPFYQNKFCAREVEHLPKEGSIQDVSRLSSKLVGKFIYQYGYKKLLDIDVLDFSTPLAKRKFEIQKSSIVENKTIVNKFPILEEIKKYQYPLYMLDFETWKSAAPKVNNTTPYEQQPFQYSLHVILSEDFDWKTMKNIKHYAYLPQNNKDNRYELALQLIKDLKRHQRGTLVAYNKSFEIGRMVRLAELFPDLEEELLNFSKEFVDLWDFFKNFWIYDQKFAGKSSIKVTLPAFEKDFSYNNLVIQKGTQSSFTFRKFMEGKITKSDWGTKYYQDMLKYCNQDTLAMVILWQKIQQLLAQKIASDKKINNVIGQ